MKNISIQQIEEFITANGWLRIRSNSRTSVYVGPSDDDGNPLELILPRRVEQSDAASRLSEAMEQICNVTQMPQEEITNLIETQQTATVHATAAATASQLVGSAIWSEAAGARVVRSGGHEWVDSVDAIPDDATLLRRIHPYLMVYDPNAGKYRPSHAAFSDGANGWPMSVGVKQLTTVQELIAGFEDHAIVSFEAGLARSLGCVVSSQPSKHAPWNAVVAGRKSGKVRRAFADECKLERLVSDS